MDSMSAVGRAWPLVQSHRFNTWADLQDKELDVPGDKEPYTQILSYHARQAREYAISKQWMEPDSWDFPTCGSEEIKVSIEKVRAWQNGQAGELGEDGIGYVSDKFASPPLSMEVQP
jgi:hypothetical protein